MESSNIRVAVGLRFGYTSQKDDKKKQTIKSSNRNEIDVTI